MHEFFEDVEVGAVADFGSYTFTKKSILAYAKRYDPQPFHLDEKAAKASLFGGLCASGWHTAAIWMKLMVAYEQQKREEKQAKGIAVSEGGPSPGFKKLRWLKPVYVGDTVRYLSRVTGKRELSSRPRWGMVASENEGWNQKGELVFSFDGQVLVERRAKG